MASLGLSTIVEETDGYRYEGQVRTGTKTKHGRGVATYKGANSGMRYEGEWQDGRQSGLGVYTWPGGRRYEGEFKDGERSGQGVQVWPDGERYEGGWKGDKKSGQGVYTWPDGRRYEGGWKDGKFSSRGLFWLPGGRVFDGTWAEGFPLQGAAMEPDGALSLATFDGRTDLSTGWSVAERALAGRVLSGGPPAQGGGGGPPAAWVGRVELRGGAVLEGELRGLRPHGPATLAEGGATYAVEYDGSRTVAEGPVPAMRKEVCRRARVPTDGSGSNRQERSAEGPARVDVRNGELGRRQPATC
jgi:hypothetical protein